MWIFLTIVAIMAALSWPYFIAAYALYKKGQKKGARQERREQEEMFSRMIAEACKNKEPIKLEDLKEE